MCNPSETSGSPRRSSSGRLLAIVAATLLLWAVAPGSASAQEQTFHACYVPEVGAMYLIQLTGLPTECLATAHEEISWTEGSGATVTDHGELSGLTDDDHPQYLRVDGGRALTGSLDVGGNTITGLSAATAGGEAVPFEQAVKNGEAAGGDLGGTFPDPSVAGLQGNSVASTAPSDGQVLTWNDGATAWEPQTAPSGVTDHGALGGLADDDHPQYLLASGGRALTGNLSADGNTVTGLPAATGAGEAVPFEQAVKNGETAGGDLTGTFPDPSVAGLQGNSVSSTAPSDGQVLTWNDGATAWEPQTAPSGVTDHGALGGLADDDHAQYLLASGVRDATDGFAVTGTYQSGSVPTEGAGTRVMWYPGKAAFRAGRVSGTAWDDSNVGGHSTAMGMNVIASGGASTALGHLATASGSISTAMGYSTTASGFYSTAIGQFTTASGGSSTAMGQGTTAIGDNSTAMGHDATASGGASAAIGYETTSSGFTSTASGWGTTASGSSSTAMGRGTIAIGDHSTAMGRTTTASGDNSTAMGFFASTNGQSGSFIYGDASTTNVITADAPNQFMVRAAGGTIFYSNSGLTAGVALAAGGSSWSAVSDAAKKENWRELDGEGVLADLAAMPIREWNYIAQADAIRHVGPTAQDFHAAFGLGEDPLRINTVDADGIALLAIQALESRTTELREELRAEREARRGLAEENEALRVRLDSMEERLDRLEANGNR